MTLTSNLFGMNQAYSACLPCQLGFMLFFSQTEPPRRVDSLAPNQMHHEGGPGKHQTSQPFGQSKLAHDFLQYGIIIREQTEIASDLSLII